MLPEIDDLGVARAQLLHASGEISMEGPHQQMEVILKMGARLIYMSSGGF